MARNRDESTASEKVWFLADAHLEPEWPASRERSGSGRSGRDTSDAISREAPDVRRRRDLLDLLSFLPERASHLYLVGDIFDFWFEYRGGPTRGHSAVLEALQQLSASGVSVHFLGGNHDYWAGEAMERMSGARVHRDPVDTTHCGRRLFIAHGDGLPPGDLRYKTLKALIRSGPAIAAFRLLPPSLGAAIGRWASGLSEITEDRIRRAMGPMKEFLIEKLAEGPHDAVVVGHLHRPAHWTTPHGDAVVVGDWQHERAALRLDERGFRHYAWRDGDLQPLELRESCRGPADGPSESEPE